MLTQSLFITIERTDSVVSKNKLVISAHIYTRNITCNFWRQRFRFDTTATTFLRTWEFDLDSLDFYIIFPAIRQERRLHWCKSTWFSRLQKIYHLNKIISSVLNSGKQFVILRFQVLIVCMIRWSFTPYINPLHWQCPKSCQFQVLWVTNIMSSIHYLIRQHLLLNDKIWYY